MPCLRVCLLCAKGIVLISASLTLLIVAALAASSAPSSVRLPKGYVCYRAPKPIQIDGRLEKSEWHAAPWTDWFEDIEGSIRPKPRYRTRVKMLWDDQYFYIGAEIEEPTVWATLTEHDSVIFQDNDFEVFIDPDGDNHEYYEFEINALNTTWDLRLVKPYRDGGPALNEWEIPGMKSAIFVDGVLNNPDVRDFLGRFLPNMPIVPLPRIMAISGGLIFRGLSGISRLKRAKSPKSPTARSITGSGHRKALWICTNRNAGGMSSSQRTRPERAAFDVIRRNLFEMS